MARGESVSTDAEPFEGVVGAHVVGCGVGVWWCGGVVWAVWAGVSKAPKRPPGGPLIIRQIGGIFHRGYGPP